MMIPSSLQHNQETFKRIKSFLIKNNQNNLQVIQILQPFQQSLLSFTNKIDPMLDAFQNYRTMQENLSHAYQTVEAMTKIIESLESEEKILHIEKLTEENFICYCQSVERLRKLVEASKSQPLAPIFQPLQEKMLNLYQLGIENIEGLFGQKLIQIGTSTLFIDEEVELLTNYSLFLQNNDKFQLKKENYLKIYSEIRSDLLNRRLSSLYDECEKWKYSVEHQSLSIDNQECHKHPFILLLNTMVKMLPIEWENVRLIFPVCSNSVDYASNDEEGNDLQKTIYKLIIEKCISTVKSLLKKLLAATKDSLDTRLYFDAIAVPLAITKLLITQQQDFLVAMKSQLMNECTEYFTLFIDKLKLNLNSKQVSIPRNSTVYELSPKISHFFKFLVCFQPVVDYLMEMKSKSSLQIYLESLLLNEYFPRLEKMPILPSSLQAAAAIKGTPSLNITIHMLNNYEYFNYSLPKTIMTSQLSRILEENVMKKRESIKQYFDKFTFSSVDAADNRLVEIFTTFDIYRQPSRKEIIDHLMKSLLPNYCLFVQNQRNPQNQQKSGSTKTKTSNKEDTQGGTKRNFLSIEAFEQKIKSAFSN